MGKVPPRCPDCSIGMDEMMLTASGYNLQFVSREDREGILGSLGAKQKFDVDGFVCSECGLSRLYANLDGWFPESIEEIWI